MQRKKHHAVTLNPRERLGDMLLEEGLVSPDQIKEALRKKRKTGQFIGQVLVELGYISEQDLVAFLVKQCKMPHLNLLDYDIRGEVLDLIPYKMCREHGVLPVDKLGSILTVAMVDPFDSIALEEIQERTGLRVKPVLSNWYDFELVFARLFGTRQAEGKSVADAADQPQEREQPNVDQSLSTVEAETDNLSDAAAPLDVKETVEPPETDEETDRTSDAVDAVNVQETSAPPEIEKETTEPSDAAGPVDLKEKVAPPETEQETDRIDDAVDTVNIRETSAPAEIEEETDEPGDAVETTGVGETLAPPRTKEAEQDGEVGVPLEGHKVAPRIARPPKARELKDADDELPIPEYTFENFLVGQVNTFTYAIARAVADAPGAEYNPLFIYGDVGLGKTHLICAIGNEVLATQPEKRVVFTSSGTFGTRLVEAIQQHDVASFREYYTKRDLLIMDDAQFLAGREKTQEEFFEIFNTLHEEHKQIIIASDKPPAELVALERRIVSRFAGGIVAGLAAPEWETRMAILKHQVDMSGCEVPEEVLSLVATRVPDDVRGLLGALHKIMAFCELVQQDMSSDLAQEVLDHLFEKRNRRHK